MPPHGGNTVAIHRAQTRRTQPRAPFDGDVSRANSGTGGGDGAAVVISQSGAIAVDELEDLDDVNRA